MSKERSAISNYIKLMRPHQYVKNGFILLPLFFALKIKDFDLLWKTFAVAAGFSLVASAIYILNDIFDIEADRKHPSKKDRPLASGAVTVPNALILLFVLVTVGGTTVGLISLDALIFVGVYVGMNLLYSFKLKHIPILDINIIAIGFVLRLLMGHAVGNDSFPLSMWIVLITFLLALFLALAKRRDDVLLSQEGKKVRKAIDGYNLEFINGAMMIMAAVTIVFYIMYTITEGTERFRTDKLYFTVFFVILGIMRYMQITFVEKKSGSPTKVLLKDLFLQLTILGWLLSFILLAPPLRAVIFGS